MHNPTQCCLTTVTNFDFDLWRSEQGTSRTKKMHLMRYALYLTKKLAAPCVGVGTWSLKINEVSMIILW
jgi:hypothetical protein